MANKSIEDKIIGLIQTYLAIFAKKLGGFETKEGVIGFQTDQWMYFVIHGGSLLVYDFKQFKRHEFPLPKPFHKYKIKTRKWVLETFSSLLTSSYIEVLKKCVETDVANYFIIKTKEGWVTKIHPFTTSIQKGGALRIPFEHRLDFYKKVPDWFLQDAKAYPTNNKSKNLYKPL